MPSENDTERLAHWLYFEHCDQMKWQRDMPLWTQLSKLGPEGAKVQTYFRALARAGMDFMYRGAQNVQNQG